MTESTRSPAAEREPLLQFFTTAHLREDLRPIADAFGELAREIAATLPRNPERTVALRKLLEAKDCAARSAPPRNRPGGPRELLKEQETQHAVCLF
jgi:hypothetical protein